MKKPKSLETPIDIKRRKAWRSRFEGYRYGVTDASLTEWLEQFEEIDRPIAARLLDSVEFISTEQVDAAFRSILETIPGWHYHKMKRQGKFAFAPFSKSAGESGDAMLHRFRLANKLNTKFFDKEFISQRDIPMARLGADDSLVFVDDFVGSGTQAVNAWKEMFSELTAGIGNVYLVTVGAFNSGMNRIKTETEIKLYTHRHLNDGDSFFKDENKHFTHDEKCTIKSYCCKASAENPCGFGGCGLVVVLAHQCPNNSLAVLHSNDNQWEPLFPRS